MLTCKEFADLHGITMGRVRQLCIAERIKGAVKFGRDWMIPDKAKIPPDGRKSRGTK